ncbi:response regulator transcription factor [Rhizobium sp. Leaf341]|uniref:response regulator transcription factor n=1 Tax=Rhizobium sp. Leaf341 TaxID=1736344 RepID=UPI000B1A3F6F|nr:response regulator transcription factor [Rhizobium sp. Leaf341]
MMPVANSVIAHLPLLQPYYPQRGLDDLQGDMEVSKLAIIDDRPLERECLARGLVANGLRMNVELFSTISLWRNAANTTYVGILINIGRDDFSKTTLRRDVRQLVADYPDIPIIFLAVNREIRQVIHAFELGVHGYISSAIGLAVCVGAISLAVAGGVFVSADNLDELRQLIAVSTDRDQRRSEIFTSREINVIDALHKGKPNKIIAYELNLRESTVKVHVRNIMKKLQVRNRTEVIFKVSAMFDD